MSEPNKAVFLSYASQDAEAARRICDALRQADIEVWFDQSELRGGDAWDQKIRRQIKECALFMPIISRRTEERAEGYFRREWRLAVERMHDMADDAAFLVPVVIDETSDAIARVPDRFRERQWTRLPGGETTPTFTERVRQLLTGPASGLALADEVHLPEPREIPGWRPSAGECVPGTPWIMEAKLGEGGVGEVWLGRHPKLNEQRVFKFCFRADRVRSLKRELTLFRVVKERVGGHPNIVRLIDVHFDEPPYYVEMDYVEGQSLKTWCDQQGGLDKVPESARLAIVAQIADALYAAHAAGVIHRDIKPGNILIVQPAATGTPPVAKLSDFGIGQVTSAEVLEGVTKAGFTQSIVAEASPQSGTQLYMAPELVAGARATPQSDIYSLGVVLFQLLVGDLHRPLTTDWPRAVEDPCLRDDLERCFAGKPEERFANAGQLASNLRSLPQRHAVLAERQAAAAMREKAARRWRAILVASVAALVVGLGASLVWFLYHNAKLRWAREQALPEITRLAGKDDYPAAFTLACQAEPYLRNDPALIDLWGRISVVTVIETTPPGADIYVKEYRKPDSAWQYLGRSPLKDLRLANSYYRWQVRAEGYALLEASGPVNATNRFVLDRVDAIPPGMVHIEEGVASTMFVVSGMPYLPDVQLKDYLIDRFEVTNRQFKEFVDRGGYSTARFWKQPFVKQGRALTWAEAMAEFRDATGRPGPSTWKNGSYAEGEADYPVTGISWFEAAAYAESLGKRLPSLYHWIRAAGTWNASFIVPLSNFAGRGLACVGSYQGMSPSGAWDMAGNAKEWCWNEAGASKRYALGGAWSDPAYMFMSPDALSLFDRSPTNGFRCIKLLSDEALAAGVDDPVLPPSRNYANEQPVSDEVFQIYRSLFSYDKTDLNARTEAVDDGDKRWRKERVSFAAAYGNERVLALVFLPKRFSPPYQAIVLFPTALAIESDHLEVPANWIEIFLNGGRAVMHPVYKSTHERRDGLKTTFPMPTNVFRDHVIQWSKDLGRSIDYLETRPDIQADKLAYVGYSWGAALGSLLPALEGRLKASVLSGGGFYLQQTLPEVSQINFAPRVTIPTLMLNGRYDQIFPLETSQAPMFRWLGTPPEHKRHVIYDAGHGNFPPGEWEKEVTGWLDRYLGSVK